MAQYLLMEAADLLPIGTKIAFDDIRGIVGFKEEGKVYFFNNEAENVKDHSALAKKQGYTHVCLFTENDAETKFKFVLKEDEDAYKLAVKKSKCRDIKLEGLILPEAMIKSIKAVLVGHNEINQDKLYKDWGFGQVIEKGKGLAMLFYGVPGTGKTKCAELMAKDLGMKLKFVDPALLWSSEPGECERTIKKIFEETKKDKTMLLFDECEVLVADRNASGQILAAATNALLQGLERFEGITVFTTNRTPQLDPAFNRRLQLKLEFPEPDFDMKRSIWRCLIPKEAPLHEDVNIDRLAKSALTGGYIKNVILNAARRALYEQAHCITMAHFEQALTDELNGMAAFAVEDDTPRLMSPGRGMQIVRG